MDASDGDRSFKPTDAPLWHQWLLFALVWGGIMLLMGILNVATYFAVTGGGVLAFVATF